MNNVSIAQAAQALNYDQSFTIEADGQMWHGTDDKRTYLTTAEIKKITDKATKTETDKTAIKTKSVITKPVYFKILGG